MRNVLPNNPNIYYMAAQLNYKFPAIILIVFVAFLSFACARESNSTGHLTMDSFTPLPMETVFEFTESEDIAFQHISSVKSDSFGNILVHDFRQPFLFMFDLEGNFLQQIGGEGRGPGEFQHVGGFMVSAGRLWIIGSRSAKIEVFEFLDSAYVNTNTLTVEEPGLLGTLLGLTPEGILVRNRTIFRAGRRDQQDRSVISLLSENGAILRDTIFTVPIHDHVNDIASQVLIASISFGNGSLVTFDGTDKIYSLWTDSLRLDSYTMDGKRERAFIYNLKPVSVTDDERDSVLNQHDEPYRSAIQKKLSKVKPVVNNLLVDSHHRIWVELLSEELGQGWFCFSEEGEPLYRIDIPYSGAELQDISGNRVLWSYLNEIGAPTFAVSKINTPEI